mgnify:CR=1 FL=1
MKTLNEYKDEQMKDSSFAKEYEEIRTEMEEVRAIVLSLKSGEKHMNSKLHFENI